jgi:hypothetical protein
VKTTSSSKKEGKIPKAMNNEGGNTWRIVTDFFSLKKEEKKKRRADVIREAAGTRQMSYLRTRYLIWRKQRCQMAPMTSSASSLAIDISSFFKSLKIATNRLN